MDSLIDCMHQPRQLGGRTQQLLHTKQASTECMQVNDINDSARGSTRRMRPLLDLFIVRPVKILLTAMNLAQLRKLLAYHHLLRLRITINTQHFTSFPHALHFILLRKAIETISSSSLL